MGHAELDRLRAIVVALPEVTECLSHRAPCFYIRDKKPLCHFHDNHHGEGRVSLWCPLPPGGQDELVEVEPERFFRPQPSASGVFTHWVGMYLDHSGGNRVDWDDTAALLDEAYRHVAPKSLVAQLDANTR